jgi:acetate kinase
MPSDQPRVLALNAGSSSIKFALYQAGSWAAPVLRGKLEQRGSTEATLSWVETAGRSHQTDVRVTDRGKAAHMVEWLNSHSELSGVEGVGHRIVHGREHAEPVRVTPGLLQELRESTAYAPDHLPLEIELMDAVGARYPEMPQVTCFDTAFHHDLIPAARLLPIPRRYYAKGVRRYGFHGLSYAFLLEELRRVAGPEAALGRIILAHLGNGASMAAVHEGRGIDTSMGLTPAAGLTMSTRSGDLDPGLVSFLARTEQMTIAQFDRLVNHESGLLGVSEVSSDMRELLARETGDTRAAEAVDHFCYQARKWVGAFAAALGGLDTLVFSAGIGEHSTPVRARICEGLGFLGIELDPARYAAHAAVISTDASRVSVRVIPTNEELMIARSTARLLNLNTLHTGC